MAALVVDSLTPAVEVVPSLIAALVVDSLTPAVEVVPSTIAALVVDSLTPAVEVVPSTIAALVVDSLTPAVEVVPSTIAALVVDSLTPAVEVAPSTIAALVVDSLTPAVEVAPSTIAALVVVSVAERAVVVEWLAVTTIVVVCGTALGVVDDVPVRQQPLAIFSNLISMNNHNILYCRCYHQPNVTFSTITTITYFVKKLPGNHINRNCYCISCQCFIKLRTALTSCQSFFYSSGFNVFEYRFCAVYDRFHD